MRINQPQYRVNHQGVKIYPKLVKSLDRWDMNPGSSPWIHEHHRSSFNQFADRQVKAMYRDDEMVKLYVT